LAIVHAILFHEESNNEGCAAGYASLAVHEHVMLLQHGFDVTVRIFQIRINGEIIVVIKIDPFMFFDTELFNFFADSELIVAVFIDDAEDTCDCDVF
jgi:hypothetical protein